MAKRLFLQKGKLLTDRTWIGGWWAQEKFNGIRCWWDGGVSRGYRKSEVPWANVAKDGRYVREQIATGLWSGNGNVFHAPEWWLETLPSGVSIDGELWVRRGIGALQECSTIVKSLSGGDGWDRVRLIAFGSPQFQVVLEDGTINEPFFKKELRGCVEWVKERMSPDDWDDNMLNTVYRDEVACLKQAGADIPETWVLDGSDEAARRRADELLCEIVKGGGEGLMIKNPNRGYECCRSKNVWKMKPYDEDIGRVVGVVDGKGRHEGSVGGLVVEATLQGKKVQFSVGTGLTDAERGRDRDDWVGRVVRVRYRELTPAGLPVEGRVIREVSV